MRNAAGEEVATGALGLPAQAPARPDIARFDGPLAIRGGGGALQAIVSAFRNAVLTPDVETSLDASARRSYRRERIVHQLLLRIAMAIPTRRRFLTPVISSRPSRSISARAAGDRLATSGVEYR